jgi:5-methylcytosine-specific restriction endonuclease McrA
MTQFSKNGKFSNGEIKYYSICRECKSIKRSEQWKIKREKLGKTPRRKTMTEEERKRRRREQARVYQSTPEYKAKRKIYERDNKEKIKLRKYLFSKSDEGREVNYRRNLKRRTKQYGRIYVEHKFMDLLNRADWKCQHCNIWVHDVRKPLGEMTKEEVCQKASVDHIVSLKDGGDSVPENLQILCMSCNSRKELFRRGQIKFY